MMLAAQPQVQQQVQVQQHPSLFKHRLEATATTAEQDSTKRVRLSPSLPATSNTNPNTNTIPSHLFDAVRALQDLQTTNNAINMNNFNNLNNNNNTIASAGLNGLSPFTFPNLSASAVSSQQQQQQQQQPSGLSTPYSLYPSFTTTSTPMTFPLNYNYAPFQGLSAPVARANGVPALSTNTTTINGTTYPLLFATHSTPLSTLSPTSISTPISTAMSPFASLPQTHIANSASAFSAFKTMTTTNNNNNNNNTIAPSLYEPQSQYSASKVASPEATLSSQTPLMSFPTLSSLAGLHHTSPLLHPLREISLASSSSSSSSSAASSGVPASSTTSSLLNSPAPAPAPAVSNATSSSPLPTASVNSPTPSVVSSTSASTLHQSTMPLSMNNMTTNMNMLMPNGAVVTQAKEYSRKSSLFKCPVCKKTFNRKFNMRRHEQIHSGVKPYTCTICNKSFYQSTALTRHQRSRLHRA